jgi:hypothetical protein
MATHVIVSQSLVKKRSPPLQHDCRIIASHQVQRILDLFALRPVADHDDVRSAWRGMFVHALGETRIVAQQDADEERRLPLGQNSAAAVFVGG